MDTKLAVTAASAATVTAGAPRKGEPAPAVRETAKGDQAALRRDALAEERALAADSAAQRAARLKELAEELSVKAESIGRKLRFEFDDEANTTVIEVYDRETEQLIRQIPAEEVLERMRSGKEGLVQLIETSA